jgi:hypothetical protein
MYRTACPTSRTKKSSRKPIRTCSSHPAPRRARAFSRVDCGWLRRSFGNRVSRSCQRTGDGRPAWIRRARLRACGAAVTGVPRRGRRTAGAHPHQLRDVVSRASTPTSAHESWALFLRSFPRRNKHAGAEITAAGERFSRCRGRLQSASRRCCPGWHWNTGTPDVRQQRSAPPAQDPEPAAGSHRVLRRA